MPVRFHCYLFDESKPARFLPFEFNLTLLVFLLVATWHTLAKQICDESFMSNLQYKLALCYSFLSITIYLTVQFIFLQDPLLSGMAPQFVYIFECYVLAFLFRLYLRRFLSLFHEKGEYRKNHLILHYVSHSQYLVIALVVDVTSLAAINFDAVRNGNLWKSKGIVDALSALHILGYSLEIWLIICMLYPPPGCTSNPQSSEADGYARYARSSQVRVVESAVRGVSIVSH